MTASTDRSTVPYDERRARFAAERDDLSRRWNRVANLRLLAFLLGATALGWGVWRRQEIPAALGVAFLAAFIGLAIYHAAVGRRRRRAALLTEINDEAAKRIARDWAALPLRHATRPPPDHPYAGDLDLFGRASLAHLLDTPATPMGETALAAWLLAPADPATVADRQAAVADLAPRLDLRQELELRGRLGAGDRLDPAPFLAWAEAEPWLARRRWLLALAWVGPVLLALLVLAQLLGLVARPYWALALVANLLLGQTLGRAAYGLIAPAARQHHALLGYAAQLELLAASDFAAAPLRRLQDELAAGGRPAPAQLQRLGRLASLPIPPSSPIYLPIQALTLWDLHVLAAMERWRAEAGVRARRWLAVLGEVEALVALSVLAHDNPDWVFPNLDPDADRLTAGGLGHPLLRREARVVNDVEVGPPGTFLLVTGSNMSGKSTLLRSIGINAVLAQAGGPVCAARCRLPPVAPWTSVRVQDSLERGVSFFMAELQRLKLVVDAADRRAATGGPRVLYLLDEILQGTNTAERQIAARRVIAHLVARGAIGAVSTHDLALADAPELAASARAVHFRDTVGTAAGTPTMSFDYTLRPGVATTTNALRLMELIGLDVGNDPAGDGTVAGIARHPRSTTGAPDDRRH